MSTDPEQALDLKAAASQWLSSFAQAVTSGDVDATVSHLLEQSWLRDLLTFTWDLRTLFGHSDIKEYLQGTLKYTGITDVELDTSDGLGPNIVPMNPAKRHFAIAFKFKTSRALGRGSAILEHIDGLQSKAVVVTMMVQDWIGFEERGPSPDPALKSTVEKQRRDIIQNNPEVLIVGAGQGGLQLAARCRQMDIKALVIHKDARVGDQWRNRYKALSLHTPRAHHSLLYSPYPSNWPIFTPSEKLADWFEAYATVHDLVILHDTTVQEEFTFSETERCWEVKLRDAQGNFTRIVRPKHVVIALGTFGRPQFPEYPSLQNFKGTVLHSSQYVDASPYHAKKVVVFGSANSATDICADLATNGAGPVTMIQRSPTCMVSIKVLQMNMNQSFPEGQPMDISDFKNAVMPRNLLRIMMRQMQPMVCEADKDIRNTLQKAGLKLHDGEDNSGQVILSFEKGGGFFIDTGFADIVGKGRIAIKGSEVEQFNEDSIAFKDGSTVEADSIIFATGYERSLQTLKSMRIIPEFILNKVQEPFGMDEEGEFRGAYRPNGHKGLWFTGGEFSMGRSLSKQLALFIRASLLGYADL